MSQGMNHFEGGWPKDINPAENDQTMRFRKKIEKDDSYINSVLGLCQVSHTCIVRNICKCMTVMCPEANFTKIL